MFSLSATESNSQGLTEKVGEPTAQGKRDFVVFNYLTGIGWSNILANTAAPKQFLT